MRKILIRGGGDLATGVAVRLHRCGFQVAIAELAQPLSVRRWVSFSEAVYDGRVNVEDVTSVSVGSAAEIEQAWAESVLPVMVDPDLAMMEQISFDAMVDARLAKQVETPQLMRRIFTVGLGPGFTAGQNCHAAIETERGHTLGRVYWTGSTKPDSGVPEGDPRRVFRAPEDGTVEVLADIGSSVIAGDLMAKVAGLPVLAPLNGVIRGMIRPGIHVRKGVKIGDVDPRGDPAYCRMVSDKAFAIAGSVLEAILVQARRLNGQGQGDAS